MSAERFRGGDAHLRHHRYRQAATGGSGADVPWFAHAHAGADPRDPANLYVYGSGTSVVRSGEELEGARQKDPKSDAELRALQHRRHQVPLNAPEQAKIVNRPRIFADATTGNIAGLWLGGDAR